MGTDIYLYAEVQQADGTWELTPAPQPMRGVDAREWDIGRNYDLYGLLAGVRGNIPPILPPRGVPDDASLEYLKLAQYDADPGWGRGGDGFGHSWYTLAELYQHDWTAPVIGNQYAKTHYDVALGLLGHAFILAGRVLSQRVPSQHRNLIAGRFLFYFG